MRYIEKTAIPPFFTDDTKDLSSWDEYKHKRRLKTHIIEHEQNALCVYCEATVSLDNSHLEHIKPKAQDKYPQLMFDYHNLAVSCQGTLHNPADNPPNDKRPSSCGHKKDNHYDETRFLDPTQTPDISAYFVYDFDDFTINSSDFAPQKSQYAIDILRLNTAGLAGARKHALRAFQTHLGKIKNIEKRKAKIIEIINAQNKPFVSALRYKYRAVFNQ
ncbi:MAG: hypothetical protein ACI8WB_001854 [Phenylobacterium sp.]|jgi:uncharacterized protein (TIGR02646 family)